MRFDRDKKQENKILKIENMNKIRIVGIILGLLIATGFIIKLDFGNMSWLNNGHSYVVIVAALFFSISNVLTWKKKRKETN